VFTATLAQRLVDQGILNWDQTLGELLGKHISVAPQVQGITLRELATHTSGLPCIPSAMEDAIVQCVGKDQFMLDPYNQLPVDAVWNYLAQPQELGKRGQFEYSNYGMGLLAHTMERVTGLSYPELLRREIWVPLGMTQAYADLPDDVAATMVGGHDASGKPCPPWRFQILAGAGSITTTANDLLRFAQAHFDAQSPLASSLARTREAQTERMAVGWARPTWWDKLLQNHDIVFHNGMVAGYASYFSIDPVHRQAVVVLINKGANVATIGMRITKMARQSSL
jgi:CubicO group peptidase (beta-lactamase class C family)